VKITPRDRELEPILEELRQNFAHAIGLDVQALRERVDLVEAENRGLRSEIDELKQSLAMLRHIASEHEERMRGVENNAAIVPVVARRTA
jgi:hypothetical protein